MKNETAKKNPTVIKRYSVKEVMDNLYFEDAGAEISIVCTLEGSERKIPKSLLRGL